MYHERIFLEPVGWRFAFAHGDCTDRAVTPIDWLPQ